MIKQQLQQLERETDLETVLEVIGIFLHSAPNQLNQMDQLKTQGDWKRLSSIAHAMKGNMAYLGSKEGWAQCAHIEQTCLTGSADDVHQALSALTEQLRQEFPYLQQVLDTGHIS